MTAKIPAKANPTAIQIPQMFQYKVKSFIPYDVNKKCYCQVKKGVLRCPRPRPRGLATPRSIRPRSRSAPLGGVTLRKA